MSDYSALDCPYLDTNMIPTRRIDEAIFQTQRKQVTAMHPTSVYGSSPSLIGPNDLVVYSQLLETTKTWVVNSTRCPLLVTGVSNQIMHRQCLSRINPSFLLDGINKLLAFIQHSCVGTPLTRTEAAHVFLSTIGLSFASKAEENWVKKCFT